MTPPGVLATVSWGQSAHVPSSVNDTADGRKARFSPLGECKGKWQGRVTIQTRDCSCDAFSLSSIERRYGAVRLNPERDSGVTA